MPSINDPEFGRITLRRSRLAKQIRLRLTAQGSITISLPLRTPQFFAKQLLNQSRTKLRQLLAQTQPAPSYQDGDLIGKSHTLRFEQSTTGDCTFRLEQNNLIISRPSNKTADLDSVIHKGVSKALRVQANAYLPRRLSQLAQNHGFTYNKTRFSSASTRWGSCSSQGTISLNIWLMQLPFEVIDYVLVHELCHTKEMNHSSRFWQLVEHCCPDYKTLRKQLRAHQPSSV